MKRKPKPRSRPAPQPAVTDEQKEELLAQVRNGVDPSALIGARGLDASAIWGDAALVREIEACYAIHTEGVRKKTIEQAAQGGHVHILERELSRREERAAELRRRAGTTSGSDGGAIGEWLALLEQLDDDEQFLVHSLLLGDVSQFRTTLRCMVSERATELSRDPNWLSGINTRWADAIRLVSAKTEPKPKPEPLQRWEVLDQGEVIPPTRAIVPLARGVRWS